MAKCYFELRKTGSGGLSTSIMRHLHTRQHLGKAVVVCDQPTVLLGAARKQWLKLARSVQTKRASTVSADKILKYTHTVTHMQHMRFTFRSPLERPDADVYFLTAGDIDSLPGQCFTVYLAMRIEPGQAARLIERLPADALLVDYAQTFDWQLLGVVPREALEHQLAHAWETIEQFLRSYNIDTGVLGEERHHDVDAMEEALDILLGANRKFLQIAHEFQRALELARPLRLDKETRQRYDAVSLLAHRVQALSPGVFTQSFLETYSENDAFFLYDPAKEHYLQLGESLSEAIARHIGAGRLHLAEAIREHPLYYQA